MGAITEDAPAVTLLVWRRPDTLGSGDAAAASEHLDLLLELPLTLPAAARVADDAAPVQLMEDSRRAAVLMLRTLQGVGSCRGWCRLC